MPGPMHWTSCAVPPPRAVSRTTAARLHRRRDVGGRPRKHHAQRYDLIAAGIGGVHGADHPVKTILAVAPLARASCSPAASTMLGDAAKDHGTTGREMADIAGLSQGDGAFTIARKAVTVSLCRRRCNSGTEKDD
jgi:hypothetical protein